MQEESEVDPLRDLVSETPAQDTGGPLAAWTLKLAVKHASAGDVLHACTWTFDADLRPTTEQVAAGLGHMVSQFRGAPVFLASEPQGEDEDEPVELSMSTVQAVVSYILQQTDLRTIIAKGGVLAHTITAECERHLVLYTIWCKPDALAGSTSAAICHPVPSNPGSSRRSSLGTGSRLSAGVDPRRSTPRQTSTLASSPDYKPMLRRGAVTAMCLGWPIRQQKTAARYQKKKGEQETVVIAGPAGPEEAVAVSSDHAATAVPLHYYTWMRLDDAKSGGRLLLVDLMMNFMSHFAVVCAILSDPDSIGNESLWPATTSQLLLDLQGGQGLIQRMLNERRNGKPSNLTPLYDTAFEVLHNFTQTDYSPDFGPVSDFHALFDAKLSQGACEKVAAAQAERASAKAAVKAALQPALFTISGLVLPPPQQAGTDTVDTSGHITRSVTAAGASGAGAGSDPLAGPVLAPDLTLLAWGLANPCWITMAQDWDEMVVTSDVFTVSMRQAMYDKWVLKVHMPKMVAPSNPKQRIKFGLPQEQLAALMSEYEKEFAGVPFMVLKPPMATVTERVEQETPKKTPKKTPAKTNSDYSNGGSSSYSSPSIGRKDAPDWDHLQEAQGDYEEDDCTGRGKQGRGSEGRDSEGTGSGAKGARIDKAQKGKRGRPGKQESEREKFARWDKLDREERRDRQERRDRKDKERQSRGNSGGRRTGMRE